MLHVGSMGEGRGPRARPVPCPGDRPCMRTSISRTKTAMPSLRVAGTERLAPGEILGGNRERARPGGRQRLQPPTPCSAAGSPRDERIEGGEGGARTRQRRLRCEGECPPRDGVSGTLRAAGGSLHRDPAGTGSPPLTQGPHTHAHTGPRCQAETPRGSQRAQLLPNVPLPVVASLRPTHGVTLSTSVGFRAGFSSVVQAFVMVSACRCRARSRPHGQAPSQLPGALRDFVPGSPAPRQGYGRGHGGDHRQAGTAHHLTHPWSLLTHMVQDTDHFPKKPCLGLPGGAGSFYMHESRKFPPKLGLRRGPLGLPLEPGNTQTPPWGARPRPALLPSPRVLRDVLREAALCPGTPTAAEQTGRFLIPCFPHSVF